MGVIGDKRIRLLLKYILSFRLLKYMAKIMVEYLEEEGWIKSFFLKKPVDKNGEPIAWVTYSFLHFITPRLNNNLSVFEYGVGNSTLFYAKRVKEVVSVEHNEGWFKYIRDNLKKENITLFLEADKDSYIQAIKKVNKKFSIVVDGIYRQEALKYCVDFLEDNGVVILDDSQRKEYKEAIEFLLQKGFKKLDFWGLAPLITFNRCTSVFYKESNCLGI